MAFSGWRMVKLSSYKELDVWKLGIEVSKDIFAMTSKFPKEQVYILSSQMQRAAISIPSNIAEGYSRNGRKEFIQFLHIALGSKSELETQLIIAFDANFIDKQKAERLSEKLTILGKMLNKMIASLKNKTIP